MKNCSVDKRSKSLIVDIENKSRLTNTGSLNKKLV